MECQHTKVIVVTKYYPGTRYEPPDLEFILGKCRDCDVKFTDWSDIPEDAEIEEVDHRDWY